MKGLKIKISKDKNKLFIGIGIVVILILGIVAFILCKDKKEDKSKDNAPDVTVKDNTTPKKLKIVDENSTSRPYAVMINNINVARPLQSGLQDAYIMYEIIVEGGITRYMALFMDQNTARIGSIRSARHYFLDYALENDAIYVHHGQSPQAQNDFSALGIDRIVVDNTKTGWRDKSLNVASEHTLFTSIEKLNNGLGKKRTTRKGNLLLNYSIDEINLAEMEGSSKADNVSIRYSSGMVSSYTYDSNHQYYLRSVNGKAHTDYVTKEQYHFKNIITYQVKNHTLNDGENKGRQNIENVGSGTGYYITDGYSIPIKWSKSSRSEKTKYYFTNGEELKVNDGNTFIQIQPIGETLTIN